MRPNLLLLTELALLVANLAAPSAPARAGAPDPVCGRAEILRFVTIELEKREFYVEVLPGTAAEVPARDGAELLCAVLVRLTVYNFRTDGPWPETTVAPRAYRVTKLNNGYSVRMQD